MIKEPIIPFNLSLQFFALRDTKTKRCPVMDFLENLKSSDLHEFKKIMALIQRIAEQGEFPRNPEKFKHARGKIFEVKSYQVRLYGFHNERREFIFTNACLKKRDKASKEDLDMADELRQRFLETNHE